MDRPSASQLGAILLAHELAALAVPHPMLRVDGAQVEVVGVAEAALTAKLLGGIEYATPHVNPCSRWVCVHVQDMASTACSCTRT